MDHDLRQSLALLGRTPAALNALLRGLPESWTHRNEGENTWTPYDVVGHLIHGERTDWMVRARIILEQGESRPFDRFDRWAQERESQGKSLPQLLDEFASFRAGNLEELGKLDLKAADLQKCGTHPALGRVTLSQLLAAWVTHDLTHLHQISRVLAHQYRDNVGPWKEYLGVLHCAGHGG